MSKQAHLARKAALKALMEWSKAEVAREYWQQRAQILDPASRVKWGLSPEEKEAVHDANLRLLNKLETAHGDIPEETVFFIKKGAAWLA